MKWEKLLLLLVGLRNVIWANRFSIVAIFSQDGQRVSVAIDNTGHLHVIAKAMCNYDNCCNTCVGSNCDDGQLEYSQFLQLFLQYPIIFTQV
jgi:hypothetical protein